MQRDFFENPIVVHVEFEENARAKDSVLLRNRKHRNGDPPELLLRCSTTLLADVGHRISNIGESGMGICAQSRNCRDAYHDDKGQHDRIFYSRRAVFSLEKLHETLSHLK